MRKLSFLLTPWALLLALPAAAQTCPTGDITFSLQSQVNAFPGTYPGCTTIEGYLRISQSNITDLTPLAQLTTVNGYLHIGPNSQLVDLDGLQQITTVGGALSIVGNTALTSLSALAGITTVGGSMEVSQNNSLSILTGLHNITGLGGSLTITENAALDDLQGLEGLESIDGGIYIAENPVLGSMQGLAPSSVGGGFELTNNLQLMDLSAASGLTTLGGPLSLIGNTSILSLQELAGITAINGVLRLTGSSGLMYLAGLDNIDPGTILNLIIANNPGLFQCAAENLCTYLADPSSMASITGNATGCASRAELEAACTVLSVDEQATADGMLAVYPNPTPGELSLLPQVQGPGQLRVYDGAGVLLRTLHIADAAHTPVRIDLSDLAPGAYVVQLHTQDGVATRMVVRD